MNNVTKVCPLTEEQKKAAREAWNDTDVQMVPGCRALTPDEAAARVYAVYAAGLRDAAPAEAAQGEDNLRFILERIIADLPTKRDWLDPALEQIARRALAPKAAQDKCEPTPKQMRQWIERGASPDEEPGHPVASPSKAAQDNDTPTGSHR